MALDDDRKNASILPLNMVERRTYTPHKTLFRVSWLVEGKRKEKFFSARAWAEKYVSVLLDAAQVVQVSIDPMIGDVVVEES